MKRYKIVVSYDGTDFYGWQIQPSDVTVVSTLKKSFHAVFNKDVSIIGASRTDAGVHAIGQVAVCKTDLSLDPEQIVIAWNNSLPNAIVIRSAELVDDDFHIFADVEKKTYFYNLFTERPSPFLARYGWFWKFVHQVDWKKFKDAIECFVGEHDFRSFCKIENSLKEKINTVRKIDSIKITEGPVGFGCVEDSIKKGDSFFCNGVCVEVTGSGFLRYQIRRMIGAALDVARREDLSVDFIKYQLENPSDQQEFVRAEGSGLFLSKIFYK